MSLCPFCLKRPANSDDHVFPQFLGGHGAVVRACRVCNNDEFGQRFEASASRTLASLLVGLGCCGVEPSGKPVWRKAVVQDGLEFDLDGRQKATLSRPQIETDSNGKIIRGTYSGGTKLKKSGPKAPIKVERVSLEVKLERAKFSTVLKDECRQLATKMAVNLSLYKRLDRQHIAQPIFDYLGTPAPPVSTVSWDFRVHDSLDALVPHLSHVIYVCGDPAQRRLFGVVQFFSAFQLYMPLNTTYEGSAVSWLATLNLKTKAEAFADVPSLGIEPAPILVTAEEEAVGQAHWNARFHRRLAEVEDGWHLTLSGPP